MGASGFQDVSQDNGLGQGPGCFQGQEGVSQATGYCVWHQVSIVCGGREFELSLGLSIELRQLGHGQSRVLEVGLTGS